MTPTGKEYRLSTGRYFYANQHILGLAPGGTATYGYDGTVDLDPHPDIDDDPENPMDRFTPAERWEVADFMMNLWNQWGGP